MVITSAPDSLRSPWGYQPRGSATLTRLLYLLLGLCRSEGEEDGEDEGEEEAEEGADEVGAGVGDAVAVDEVEDDADDGEEEADAQGKASGARGVLFVAHDDSFCGKDSEKFRDCHFLPFNGLYYRCNDASRRATPMGLT